MLAYILFGIGVIVCMVFSIIVSKAICTILDNLEYDKENKKNERN